jgi:prepilin-type N-terminal cleavage/methylation domain-containing protein
MTLGTSRSYPPGGFTVIELLIVLAIIVTLAAIAFPAYQNIREKANVSKDLHNLRQIGLAIHLYADDNGSLPGEQWPSCLESK